MRKFALLFCLGSLILPSLSVPPPPVEPEVKRSHIQNLRECIHFTFFAPSALTIAYHNHLEKPNASTTHEYWEALYTTFKGPHSECLAAYNHYQEIRSIFDKIEPVLRGYKNSCNPNCDKLSML